MIDRVVYIKFCTKLEKIIYHLKYNLIEEEDIEFYNEMGRIFKGFSEGKVISMKSYISSREIYMCFLQFIIKKKLVENELEKIIYFDKVNENLKIELLETIDNYTKNICLADEKSKFGGGLIGNNKFFYKQ